ncbi:uncharacterized protein [Fopius arisanus]|uniref:LFC_2 protein n=1 Tax=Fopius arisanus TaxID=64838 RepID=A0A0C9RZ30_9HYME|nr:PREDICTED: uncharacterized protein LOC105264826 [Fopius arisanus]
MTIMWSLVLVLLCATGITAGILVEAQTDSINLPPGNGRNNEKEFQGIRRFACPVGFFRLKRNCYYLSAGVAQWRDAYFHCKDRNSTLAELDKNGKDRTLRKYLIGEQFTRLERWIGGMYNWKQMAWQWGVKGEKVIFQNFAGALSKNPSQYEWHCIVLDPSVKYRWTPRSCFEKKHYICEVPAGRIGRRRKKTVPSELGPQNQRLRPRKKGKRRKKGKNDLRAQRRGRLETAWNKDWVVTDNQEWAHGVKLGSRPPADAKPSPEIRHTNRTRHRNNRNRGRDKTPQINQIAPQGHEYGAFLGDGPDGGRPKALSDDKTLSHYHAKINDLSLEEVLLKT